MPVRRLTTVSCPVVLVPWLASALLVPAGCAVGPVSTTAKDRGAEGALERAFERERHRPDARAMRVEPPAGAPFELGEVATGDRAHMSLADVMRQFASFAEAPDGTPNDVQPPFDPGSAREALRSYVIGRARRLAGEVIQAEGILKESVRLDPTSAEAWRELGLVQLMLENRAAAATAFRRALALKPDEPFSLEALGRDAFERRDFEQAVRLLSRLRLSGGTALDPALPYLTSARLGRSLLELGYLSAAEEVLREALTLPEQFGHTTQFQTDLAVLYRQRGELWRDLGDAAMRLGRVEAAAECYKQAEALPTLNPLGITPRRVYAAMRLGRPAEAAAIVLDEIREAGGRVEPRLHALLRFISINSSIGLIIADTLGEMERRAVESGDLPAVAWLVRARAACLPDAEAMAILREHLRLSPADEGALRDLFQRIDSSDLRRLVAEAADLIESSPFHDARYANAALSRRRDPSALLDALTSFPSDRAGSPAARLLRARLLMARGDLSAAERELASLELFRPGFGPAVAARTSVLWRLGRADEARALVDSLSETSDPGVLDAKVLALAELGEHERALSILSPALPVDDRVTARDADRLFLAGRLSLALGRYAEAERWFSLVTRVDPTREEAHAALITLYGRGGPLADETRLFATIRALRDANPSSTTLRWLRAQEALARGQLDLAERDLLDLSEDSPPQQGVVESLVRLWRILGQTERAEAWLREQGQRRPEESVFAVQTALLLADTNRMDEALSILESRLALQPGDDDASRALESLLRRDPSQRDRADALARTRLARSPNTPEAMIELAEIAVRSGELDHAADAVRRALSGGRSLRPDLANRLSQLAADLGAEALQEKRDAVSVIEVVSEIAEDWRECPPDIHIVLIRLLCRSPAPVEQIIEASERASERHPGRRVEFFVAAFDALARGRAQGRPQGAPRRPDRLDDAVAILEHVCSTTNPPPAALHSLWLLHVSISDETRDVNAMVKALEIARRAGVEDRLLEESAGNLRRNDGGRMHVADVAYQLAVILNSELPDHPLVEWLYRAALRHEPNHIWAHNNLGYSMLEKDRNVAEAVRLIERAYRLMKDDPGFRDEHAPIVDSMGWARYKTGVIHDEVDAAGKVIREGAVTLLKRAADLVRARAEFKQAVPIILDHLGDAYWVAGERENAMAAWLEAMSRAEVVLAEAKKQEDFKPDALMLEVEQVRAASWSKIQAANQDQDPPVAPIHPAPPLHEPNDVPQGAAEGMIQ